ncbi:hypothetical protein [Devosia sp. FKR38]|uniref:hypothetical protein n=1 Tax=Devosia sp. FKR38 TaxID=2562312 RepID=UPI0010BFDB94|nr:hypothetical protein [Devosia sp. FKR38]
MTSLRDIGSFIRWRLIPVRYATMLMEYGKNAGAQRAGVSKTTGILDEQGYHAGPTLDAETVAALREIYVPRGKTVVPKDRGAPFVNLVKPEDFTVDSPLMKVAFSQEVLDPAIDYFGGRLTLDSIQVLYSYPTEKLRESQFWHKDYGDRKSFHCVIYLNDVLTDDKGPFVFVDKNDTKKIRKSITIRRLADDELKAELGNGEVRTFYGKAGESVFVDPAVCYHYGSRCTSEPRFAIFVTFNTVTPFVPANSQILDNAERLVQVAAQLRPDLNPRFLRNIVRLN